MTDALKLTQEEEAALLALAKRGRDQENSEAAILQRWANRGALAKQVWTIGISCGTAIVFGTMFVLGVKNQVDQNTKALSDARTEISELTKQVFLLRLEMKDKADRPRP